MDINQEQIIKVIQSTLANIPSYNNLSIDNEDQAAMLSADIGSAKISIASNPAFARFRCDTKVQGGEDEATIVASKINELMESYNLTANHVVDGNRVAIMTLILYEDIDKSNLEKVIVQKVTAFCNAVRKACIKVLGDDLQNDIATPSDSHILPDESSTAEISIGLEENNKDDIIDEISAAIPNFVEGQSSEQSHTELDDILAKLAQSESVLENGKTTLADDDVGRESSENEEKRRKRRRNKRNKRRDVQRKNAECEAESIEYTGVQNEDIEPIEEPKEPEIKDVLTSENYESYPELRTLRDRLYEQAQQYMHQTEARANARERKLNEYKAELDKTAESLALSQQALNDEIAQKKQSIQDEIENQRKIMADEKQSAMDEIDAERDNLAAAKREIEFQTSQLKADRSTLERERAELEEDKEIFKQRAAIDEDAPEFIHIQLMQLQAENSDLRKQVEELNGIKAQAEELKSQMSHMVPAEIASIDPKELDALSDENAKIRNVMALQKDAIAAYDTELNKAKDAAAKATIQLEQERSRFEQERANITHKIDDSELQSFKDRIHELLDESSSLKSDLADAKSDADVLRDQNEDLKRQIVQLRNTATDFNGPRNPRYTLQEVQTQLESANIEVDVKPGNGQTFLVGTKDGCSVNINFDDDFVYIEKKCRNAKRLINAIGEWNQSSGITFNYWCDADKVMCRIDYTLRPRGSADETLTEMITEVCKNFETAK